MHGGVHHTGNLIAYLGTEEYKPEPQKREANPQ